ncbi:MAG: hypothetical protein RBU21_17310, partial [FCB group bacterium]|nr:hypothetical protein [FCB group bacterium]
MSRNWSDSCIIRLSLTIREGDRRAADSSPFGEESLALFHFNPDFLIEAYPWFEPLISTPNSSQEEQVMKMR